MVPVALEVVNPLEAERVFLCKQQCLSHVALCLAHIDLEAAQARILRRRITFELDRHGQLMSGALDRRDELEVSFESGRSLGGRGGCEAVGPLLPLGGQRKHLFAGRQSGQRLARLSYGGLYDAVEGVVGGKVKGEGRFQRRR